MTGLAIPLPRARRRRRKPPPPSFWSALVLVTVHLACICFWAIEMAGDMASGSALMAWDVLLVVWNFKLLLRGLRGLLRIGGIPVVFPGSWAMFRAEFRRWLEDE